MCLTKKKKFLFPKIARESITVYKLVRRQDNGELTPPHTGRYETYTLGKIMKAKRRDKSSLFKDIFRTKSLSEGWIHSAKDLYSLAVLCSGWNSSWNRFEEPAYRIIKCEIPAGTLYYEGRDGHDLCSRKLIMLEMLPLKEEAKGEVASTG